MNEHTETAAPAPAAAAAPLSEGQRLVDALNEQTRDLVLLQRLVAALRTGVIGTPAPSEKVIARIPQPPARSVSFFAGLDLIKRNNGTAITAAKRDVEDLARIFGIDLSDAIAEHREEEANVGAIGG